MTTADPNAQPEANKPDSEAPQEAVPTPDANEEGITPPPSGEANSKELLELNLRRTLSSFWEFIKDLMNIKEDTDYEGSVVSIKAGIDFRGYNVWVLICSIFIASIGLNTNSAAVIIGAMLISPLMGPIVGAGLAVGTNDFQTLVRSVKSFAIAAGISILTSFIYFKISPLSAETSELLGRVRPTVLDVLVAVFGGMAGIIAVTRKEKTNVIPGVAIATALMPPLCTAGYGLAIGNMTYFLGAFYLFLLNSVFICLASFIAIRYLKFPIKTFVNPARESKVKRYIFIFILLVIIPSGWKFWEVIQSSRFDQRVTLFVKEECKADGIFITNYGGKYSKDTSSIDIVTSGKFIPEDIINQWRSDLNKYDLEGTKLNVIQSSIDLGALEDLGKNNGIDPLLFEEAARDNTKLIRKVASLEKTIDQLTAKTIDYEKLQRNLELDYPEIENFSYGLTCAPGASGSLDTTYTFVVQWQAGLDTAIARSQEQRLEQFLSINFATDSVMVVSY